MLVLQIWSALWVYMRKMMMYMMKNSNFEMTRSSISVVTVLCVSSINFFTNISQRTLINFTRKTSQTVVRSILNNGATIKF